MTLKKVTLITTESRILIKLMKHIIQTQALEIAEPVVVSRKPPNLKVKLSQIRCQLF